MVRTHPTVAMVQSEPLQLFGLTVQPPRRFSDSRWRGGLNPDSVAGSVRIAERVCSQPIPVRQPEPRPRPGPEPGPAPAPAPAGRTAAAASGGVRMSGHGSLPIAHENSKYPKGTPFVLNFLYLNTTNFHPMANVGLNAFSYL